MDSGQPRRWFTGPHRAAENLFGALFESYLLLRPPRPDFDLAAHEFLIGLLAVAFPPKGQCDWLRYFHTPPTPEELQEVFQRYAAAFSLDGEGPRFLQDFSPLEGEPSPVEALFI